MIRHLRGNSLSWMRVSEAVYSHLILLAYLRDSRNLYMKTVVSGTHCLLKAAMPDEVTCADKKGVPKKSPRETTLSRTTTGNAVEIF